MRFGSFSRCGSVSRHHGNFSGGVRSRYQPSRMVVFIPASGRPFAVASARCQLLAAGGYQPRWSCRPPRCRWLQSGHQRSGVEGIMIGKPVTGPSESPSVVRCAGHRRWKQNTERGIGVAGYLCPHLFCILNGSKRVTVRISAGSLGADSSVRCGEVNRTGWRRSTG